MISRRSGALPIPGGAEGPRKQISSRRSDGVTVPLPRMAVPPTGLMTNNSRAARGCGRLPWPADDPATWQVAGQRLGDQYRTAVAPEIW